MVVLTKSQAINMAGRIHVDTAQVVALIPVIFDPNSSQTDVTNAKAQVKAAILEIYQLMNTACNKQGYTPPAGILTDQQLAALGIT